MKRVGLGLLQPFPFTTPSCKWAIVCFTTRASKATRGQVKVLGVRRNVAALTIAVLGLLILFTSGAYRPLLLAFAISTLCIVGHATFRSPNFKARLASARDKLFKQAWYGSVRGCEYLSLSLPVGS